VITIHQRYRHTDGRTDGQTTCHGSTALRYTLLGKKYVYNLLIHSSDLYQSWSHLALLQRWYNGL